MIKKLTSEGRYECGLDAVVRGKVWAFVPVIPQSGPAVAMGVALANEPGYAPVPAHWCHGDDYDEMYAHAEELNAVEGKSPEESMRTVASTMRRGEGG